MTEAEEVVGLIVVGLVMVGPAILLLLLRRWTRRWWAAFAGTLVIAPFAAFLLGGGVAWLATYCRVVVNGDTSIPNREGWTVRQYLAMTFVGCGMYGVLFAGTGFALSLPWVGLWRLVHRSSFNRLTRC